MSDERSEFLSLLLGREVDWRDNLRLTSGQKARYFAWCSENNLEYRLGEDASPSEAATDTSGLPQNATYPPEVGSLVSLRGVGIDLQEVSELFPELPSSPKSDPALKDIFTLRELSYAEGADDVRQTLAGIFAAKEAVYKVLGTREKRRFRDVEILPDEHGIPSLEGYHLSVSHSGGFAIAVAAGLGDLPGAGTSTSPDEMSDREDTSSSSAGRQEAVRGPTLSRRRRAFQWAVRGIVLAGTVGGIWVLLDKLQLIL